MARSRWQFSLASLLLVVTICCLSLSLCSTAHSLREARQNLKICQEELNTIDPSSFAPDKVHIRSLLANCRVFIPEDRTYKLHVTMASDHLQKLRPGLSSTGTLISPGQYSIFVEAFNRDGKSCISVRSPGKGLWEGNFTGCADRIYSDWVAVQKSPINAGSDVTHHTAKPGEPLVLFRLKELEVVEQKQTDGTIDKYHREPKLLPAGLIVWIEAVDAD